MIHRTLVIAMGAAALGISACGGSGSSTGSTATATSTATSSATSTVASSGASGANTAAVVKAADAFLATLSSSQKSSVVFAFDDTAKTKTWSNLPAALAPRAGIALGDMSTAQQTAALKLMQTALSRQGYDELQAVRQADDYLASQSQGGGPGAGDYGSGNYYFAFYGTPSTTDPWLLQYTGHHETFNIGYHGKTVTFGPEFAGVEPISFTKDGTTIAPMTDETKALGGIVTGLTSSQLNAAKLSQSYDDLLLGAGNDGPFPSPAEGVLVSDLSQAAQDQVTAAIRAYVGDLGGSAANRLIKAYVADYDKTKFAYQGSTKTTDLGFYARIQGPKLWIELSTQHGIVLAGNHYHSIYREQGSDYGA